MSTASPRLRCRAGVWGGPRGMSHYQCWNAAKPDTSRDLSGNGGRVERLPVCGTHARVKYDPGAYYWHNESVYESKVAEYKP